ncbi:type II toxin-antitoxin system RelE/ParE family toxin [Duganella aceris]|uniref:Type II toxin-antitoxin system RelE/ParE family toxin n=1 Tax=Duganella aceris TaxID=2703883 RepID=A0ABX0FMT7_9BURK|nr:type II toxin-antitoxin system RelE/ParE family toxin [Duganella aceris]NGZ85793.1 type II toxin-antitoxin system RelE/ParE family toxin [Duganella aceris]
MKPVVRTMSYLADLDDIERFIARNNPQAAASLCLHVDDQVEQLGDPYFPRRRGRVSGTFELVAHKNYVVIFLESATEITALNIIHTRKRYP